jgi:RNA-directed DNA polymerase
VLVRYADDLLALCHTREQAEQVKARLVAWLAPRGLVFNEDKTRIAHLDDGVDFLGFNVRRYRGKLLIKPSKAAVKRIRARLTTEMRAPRAQRPDGAHQAQPDHSGLVGLLPAGGVCAGVQRVGHPRVEARLQVGEVHPSTQVEALDHHPVLRRVQLGQA